MNLIAELTQQLGTPDLTGLQQLQALIASGRRPGIADTLGFTLTAVEEGLAVFEGTPGQHAYSPIGMVHGGYAATLLDSACGCAVHSTLSARQLLLFVQVGDVVGVGCPSATASAVRSATPSTCFLNRIA